ncbi:MAG: S16 family serine protease [Anaerolineales bacterium]
MSRTIILPKFNFGFTWLIIIPAGVWTIAGYYLPLFSENLTQFQTWIVTLLIILMIGVSLALHIIAHLWTAMVLHQEVPAKLTLLIFGDASQSWLEADSSWKGIVIAGAGPIINLLLAGLTYLLWNAQINYFLSLITLCVSGFNAWIFLINLLPAFPMDGGRFIKACLQGLMKPSVVARWIKYFGVFIAVVVTGWGIFLFTQHARFSTETGLITFAFVLLLLDGLRIPALSKDEDATTERVEKNRTMRFIVSGILTLILLGVSATFLLTNNGLDAPGVALSVESMVNVPAQYRHLHKGTFILTTVISHAPILAGEWFVGKFDPAMVILPPEVVVPQNTTPQEQAKQDYQMLDDSEATAITVGLRLAGYQTQMVGKGARVVSILPGSHANGILNLGDVVTGLNGTPIQTTSDLIEQVQAQSASGSVRLEVERNQTPMEVTIPLMAPTSSSDSPKIGIAITSAGFDYKTPFPISIVTQKINGGPSAGLMFTLTVYNMLTPDDLTRGLRIAGTGTINLDGTVGPIGGVQQKVAAAEQVGAVYFLCPADNYADAISVAKSIKVIKIATAQQAIDFLHSLPAK